MRIIYLHQYFKFPDETGGTRSYDLAKTFIEKGHEVIVVTASSEEKYKTGHRWTEINREGIKVYYIYLPYGNHLSHIKRIQVFLGFLYFSTLKLFKLKADVVLSTSTPLTIGVPVLFYKWIKKVPYIFEVRDVWPEAVIAIGAIKNRFMQKVLYSLERIIYKNAEAIVPLSVDMQKSIVNRYPGFTTKTDIVIENISEINRFQDKEGVSLVDKIGFEPRFSVLYAGTFGKVNGIHKVVELAKETLSLDPSLVYILIGTGAEKESVQAYAQESGVLNKNVFILGSVQKSELASWYQAVSMGSSFVIDIPALWANSANKFFDTLAANKPVLINHEGWQADEIRSSDIGYVLPFQITTDVAKEFVSYTLDTDLIHRQEENALAVAKAKYSLTKAGDKYEIILNKIAERNV